jgi:hypothetical protein
LKRRTAIGCIVCQKNKPQTGLTPGALHPFQILGSPWEIMSWDMIGPFPESRTYNAIVTMVNVKMKAIKLEPADVTITARGIVVIMENWVFREEGLPAEVISDHGPQFMSWFMKELYSLLGIEGNPSMAYHPQTDGQTERMNREVGKFLRMFTNFQQDNWVNWLPLAEFTYNNAINESTGQTPFYLNKGRHPRTLPTDLTITPGTAAEEFLDNIRKAIEAAEESLRKAKESMKRRWEKNRPPPRDFREGDQVLVMAHHLPSNRPSGKLDQKWRGPFHIVKKVGEAAYELDLPAGWKGQRVFNETRLKLFYPPVFENQEKAPMRPEQN